MDITLFLRAAAALILVLGLIGLGAWGLRRFGWGMKVAAVRNADRRLAVQEVLTLDARHRLVLVSRDGTEHLLLLGLDGNRIVETGVSRSGTSRSGIGVEREGDSE